MGIQIYNHFADAWVTINALHVSRAMEAITWGFKPEDIRETVAGTVLDLMSAGF